MCLPVAQYSNRSGDALLEPAVKLKSVKLALPVLPPPPKTVPSLDSPHENDSISISSGCFESVDSPLIPVSFRNASNAMASPLTPSGRW